MPSPYKAIAHSLSQFCPSGRWFSTCATDHIDWQNKTDYPSVEYSKFPVLNNDIIHLLTIAWWHQMALSTSTFMVLSPFHAIRNCFVLVLQTAWLQHMPLSLLSSEILIPKGFVNTLSKTWLHQMALYIHLQWYGYTKWFCPYTFNHTATPNGLHWHSHSTWLHLSIFNHIYNYMVLFIWPRCHSPTKWYCPSTVTWWLNNYRFLHTISVSWFHNVNHMASSTFQCHGYCTSLHPSTFHNIVNDHIALFSYSHWNGSSTCLC